jgi:hypothetical protein
MISIRDVDVLPELHMVVLITESQSVFARPKIEVTDWRALMQANTFVFRRIQGYWVERYEVGWNRIIAFAGISRLHQAWI